MRVAVQPLTVLLSLGSPKLECWTRSPWPMSKSSDDPQEQTAAKTATPAAQPYVVLARKYRPQTLLRPDRPGHSGPHLAERIRDGAHRASLYADRRPGGRKTTTARILARALNYERPGLPDKPTLDIAELGVHCQAIMESRHIDVLEMDAASNTGIGDIREIIEAVRYKPASARYRVFIIDEVHMLSKSAFNGLLKTLEEPPPM